MRWKFWSKPKLQEPESGTWPDKEEKLLKSEDLKKMALLFDSQLVLADAQKSNQDLSYFAHLINSQAARGKLQTKILLLDEIIKDKYYPLHEVAGVLHYRTATGLMNASQLFNQRLQQLGYQVVVRPIHSPFTNIHGTSKEYFVGYELVITWN